MIDQPNYIFYSLCPCDEWELERTLDSLVKYGHDVDEYRQIWQKVLNAKVLNICQVTIPTVSLTECKKHGILKEYYFRFFSNSFCDLTLPEDFIFTPPPNLPTLWASDQTTHYLWCSVELREMTLQLWLHINQNKEIFRKVINKVWAEYATYTKFSCGYGGECEKLATRLRQCADELLKSF